MSQSAHLRGLLVPRLTAAYAGASALTGLGSVQITMQAEESTAPKAKDKPRDIVEDKVELLLGVRVESLSPTWQFLYSAGGAIVFFIIYGYVQEALFRLDGMKPHALYVTLVQFALYSLLGCLEMALQKQRRKIPLQTYSFLAFLTLATMGLSNFSLGYLNYPTQVIFKSCKLIPVMIGSVIIVGRRYGPIDISAVLLMCLGLVWFTLADSSIYPSFDYTGIVLIMLALCADALIGNYQEKAMKKHDAGNTEVVTFSYSIGFVYLIAGLTVSGYLVPSVTYFNSNSLVRYGHVGCFALSGYLGIKFVLSMIKCFGALVAVTVTTLRKALTMALSFLVFVKPFTIQYVWSGVVILIGIALNIYGKNRTRIDPWLHQKWQQWRRRRLPMQSEIQPV